jgi:hypothetical protein
MPKVVRGDNFDKFVQTGEHQTIDAGSKKPVTPPPEKSEEAKAAIAKAEAETAASMKVDEKEETGLEPGDEDLAERAQTRINKKHREMRQAEALAKKLRSELDETENFSKAQYQRAQLAEERAADLTKQLTQLQAAAPKVEPGLTKPDHTATKYYDEKGQFKAFEYAEDLSSYSATKAVDDDRKRQTEERTKAQQAEIVKAFEARLERAREKYPDFKEVVGTDTTIVPPYIQQYMVESDFGGDLGYFFVKNPAERDRIFALSPIKAIAAIGKVESQWEVKGDMNPPAKTLAEIIPPTRLIAPAPVTPLSGAGSAGVNADPAKMSPKELLAYTREREMARKKRG